MKNSILIIMGFLFLGGHAFSQDKSNEEKVTDVTKQMQSQIGFNDETYTKVYDVNLEFVTKIEKLKNSDDFKITKFRALKEYDEKRKKDLKSVLTKEEYKEFEKHRSENMAVFKGRLKEVKES